MLTPSTTQRKGLKQKEFTTGTPESEGNYPKQSQSKMMSNENSQYENYLRFKQKLLRAMVELDPLDLLQSGIFQEYEATFGRSNHHIKPVVAKIPSVSAFQSQEAVLQSKMNSYRLSKAVRVTQVEPRSRSCDPISKHQQAIKRLQTQRNCQFVLFANTLRHLGLNLNNSQRPSTSSVLEESLQKQQQTNKIYAQDGKLDQIEVLVVELQQKNEQLSVELEHCLSKLEHQKNITLSTQNARQDKELQFLLKQKQLQKKLQEVKEQNERLRQLLQPSTNIEQSQEHIVQNQKGEVKDKLASLKERVAAQGRVRWALSRAWGAQLEAKCL